MSLRHVSMHGVPQPYAARPSCITKINLGARCMIQHRIHRPGLAVHGRHRQEQQGPSCFTAAGAHRLRHRSLARRIAAGSSDSMTEEGPGSDIDLSQFVDLANELAEVAGSITKKFFRQPLTIDNKADKSPVTEADRQAEHAMRQKIAETFPDHGIFGEEEGMQQPRDTDAQYLWVLDPIDGTKSFITEQGVRTRHCKDISLAYLYATTPHMFSPEDNSEQAFNSVRDAVRTPLYGCDCYAYGLLASGYVDLVVEADLKPYDFMALVPIVEEAGGIMTDWLVWLH
ncbi:hypothetical protein ABBQ32_012032 [Trebouxia sp. C0010 RCD-2024]